MAAPINPYAEFDDLFERDVDPVKRDAIFAILQAERQTVVRLMTNHISHVTCMIPRSWLQIWPRNIGIIFQVETQEQFDREALILTELKTLKKTPWIAVKPTFPVDQLRTELTWRGETFCALEGLGQYQKPIDAVI